MLRCAPPKVPISPLHPRLPPAAAHKNGTHDTQHCCMCLCLSTALIYFAGFCCDWFVFVHVYAAAVSAVMWCCCIGIYKYTRIRRGGRGGEERTRRMSLLALSSALMQHPQQQRVSKARSDRCRRKRTKFQCASGGQTTEHASHAPLHDAAWQQPSCSWSSPCRSCSCASSACSR
jgi:hypothetical protein